MLVDLELDGFIEVADKQQEMKSMLEGMKENDPSIVGVAIDFKERRGSGMPDLKNMKLRGA
tara:strand:+ start:1204 stop:1386 length:183 start_codon:yes stop_codon:yes gene_type:complete